MARNLDRWVNGIAYCRCGDRVMRAPATFSLDGGDRSVPSRLIRRAIPRARFSQAASFRLIKAIEPESFLSSIGSALRLYRPELSEGLPPDMPSLMASLKDDDPFKIKHSNLIAQYEAHTVQQGTITLSEVAEMKRLAEAVLTNALANRLQKRAQKADESGDPGGQTTQPGKS
jgi:hypothetical protein